MQLLSGNVWWWWWRVGGVEGKGGGGRGEVGSWGWGLGLRQHLPKNPKPELHEQHLDTGNKTARYKDATKKCSKFPSVDHASKRSRNFSRSLRRLTHEEVPELSLYPHNTCRCPTTGKKPLKASGCPTSPSRNPTPGSSHQMDPSKLVPSTYHLPGNAAVLTTDARPHPTRGRSPPRPRTPTPSLTRRHQEPWARHELAAWMGSTPGTVPTPSANPTPHLIFQKNWGKVRKPHCKSFIRSTRQVCE